MAMGLLGAYPFGGAIGAGMRQQLLYPIFAVPAGFVAFDVALRHLSGARARAAVSLVVVLLAANLARQAWRFRGGAERDFERQVRSFRDRFPGARTVQVDQLNLVGFFIAHHDWDWRFGGRVPGTLATDRFEIEKDGRRVTLLAHRNHWNFDFHDATLYPALASGLGPADPGCFTVFCVHTNLYKDAERRLPDLDQAEVEATVRALAPPAGIEPRRIAFEGNDVYAEFCRIRHQGP